VHGTVSYGKALHAQVARRRKAAFQLMILYRFNRYNSLLVTAADEKINFRENLKLLHSQ
jgi:hypothetical protein